MRRILLIFVILLFSRILPAPVYQHLYITEAPVIEVFDPILWAVKKVESNFNPTIVNKLNYGGIIQIGQEMIDEANRICKLTNNPYRFVLNDRLSITKSTQIWYVVQNYWNPKYTLQKAGKIWNPMASDRYFKKLKKEVINGLWVGLAKQLIL